jgi:hypothetical protein
MVIDKESGGAAEGANAPAGDSEAPAPGGDVSTEVGEVTDAPPSIGLTKACQTDINHIRIPTHYNCVALLKDPPSFVLDGKSEFPFPLTSFRNLLGVVLRASNQALSSVSIEQPWAKLQQFHSTKTSLNMFSLNTHFTITNDITMGVDYEKVTEDEWEAALELAKDEGWDQYFGFDHVEADAAQIAYKRSKKKGPDSFSITNHDGNYREARWLNPTGTELNALERIINKVRLRLGKEGAIVPVKNRRQRKKQVAPDASGNGSASGAASGAGVDSTGVRESAAENVEGLESACWDAMIPDEAEADSAADVLDPHNASSFSEVAPPGSPAGEGGVRELDEDRVDTVATGANEAVDGILEADGSGVQAVGNSESAEARDGVPLAPPSSDVGISENLAAEESHSDSEEEEAESDISTDLESPESDSESFGYLSVNTNPWSVAICYDAFNGVAPRWPRHKHNVWELSQVAISMGVDGRLQANVTRRPTRRLQCLLQENKISDAGINFIVEPGSGLYHYIRYDSYAGVQLVVVERIYRPAGSNDANQWSRTMEFRRLMTSEEAYQSCDAEKDRDIHVGKKTLREILAESQGETQYHIGECTYQGDVRGLIGIVRWYPKSSGQPDKGYFNKYLESDLLFVGKNARETGTVLPKRAKTSKESKKRTREIHESGAGATRKARADGKLH